MMGIANGKMALSMAVSACDSYCWREISFPWGKALLPPNSAWILVQDPRRSSGQEDTGVGRDIWKDARQPATRGGKRLSKEEEKGCLRCSAALGE